MFTPAWTSRPRFLSGTFTPDSLQLPTLATGHAGQREARPTWPQSPSGRNEGSLGHSLHTCPGCPAPKPRNMSPALLIPQHTGTLKQEEGNEAGKSKTSSPQTPLAWYLPRP